jgi:predicted N-acetyltransferase YhbS
MELDLFFRTYAGQNQFKTHIGSTYVAVGDDGAIFGYATVSVGSIEVEELPLGKRKRLPRYPLPILRLARLAVDATVSKQGVGKALLRYVFTIALRLAPEVGCVGVVVDAKDAQAAAYYARFGFEAMDVLEGASDARPQPVAMFLPLADIRAAA